MSRVIPFPGTSPRLREALEATRDDLEQTCERLHLAAIRVVTEGAWREWNDTQPDGTVMTFELEAMRQSGDPTVRELLDLLEHAAVVMERIEERVG